MFQQSSFVSYLVHEEHGVFSFETETGNKKSIEFTDYTETFGTDFPVYCIDILSQDISNKHKNESSGSTTRDTIVSIVKRFFENFDCALVAFIDTSTDKKGKARYRLFMSWFKAIKDDDFILEPREIIDCGTESYSLLIIRKSYGNAEQIIEDFDNFIKQANSPDED